MPPASKSPSWQWVAGIVLAICLSLIGCVYAALRSDVADNTRRNNQQDVSIGRIQTDIDYIKDGVDDIKQTLRNP